MAIPTGPHTRRLIIFSPASRRGVKPSHIKVQSPLGAEGPPWMEHFFPENGPDFIHEIHDMCFLHTTYFADSFFSHNHGSVEKIGSFRDETFQLRVMFHWNHDRRKGNNFHHQSHVHDRQLSTRWIPHSPFNLEGNADDGHVFFRKWHGMHHVPAITRLYKTPLKTM